ncbi:RnfH family protein [Frateuria sp. STR12]|uniref:RnfH family protein n=1 Tax=Frateuria hangzhouensis TaxID=2995589 RepID=UPI002260FCEB|nr:RnfH family protein [Frateuria sp. STR12]MCX7512427.1 RnfH family protein [Frateuria sp. STR12]
MVEIVVEVVMALPRRMLLKRVALADGATVADAIEAAQLGEDVQIDPQQLGIFGRRVPLGQPLRDGDRVEVYRPLLLDPKEARRRRAR